MKTKITMIAVIAASLTAACTSDPHTYTATPEQMAKAMVGKSSTYMRQQYKHTMRVTSGSAKGVNVSLSADGGSESTCRIRFEPVDESTTRIVPDCGKANSAMQQSAIDFKRIKVYEQAKHILTGEPVDVAFLENAFQVNAMKNLPKMQKEALQMDAQMRNMRNEYEAERQNAADAARGWGT